MQDKNFCNGTAHVHKLVGNFMKIENLKIVSFGISLLKRVSFSRRPTPRLLYVIYHDKKQVVSSPCYYRTRHYTEMCLQFGF